MVMPSAAFSDVAAAFFPENFYLCKLTFCGLTFETLAEALQDRWSAWDRRFWGQLAGPYRVGRVVFQHGGLLRTGLNKVRRPFRTARSRQELIGPEELSPAMERPAGVRIPHSRSMMAHDMKSSLVLIGGFIQRLSGPDVDPERRRRYLETIRKEGERLLTLLDDFVAVPEKAGELQAEVQPLLLDRELHDICEAHHLRAEQQGIALVLEYPPKLAPLSGDVKGLQRAFANLLDNALKYSSSGGAIRVQVREEDREVHISFIDEGPGIKAGDLPYLFEKFYRGQGHGCIKGSGLGLATVKAVAAAHGGRVEAKNGPEKGAVFTMVLPRHAQGD